MLVLSRKQTESIIINDNIVVTVLSVRGNKVQLGVDAPREMSVLRSELDRRQASVVKNSRPHPAKAHFVRLSGASAPHSKIGDARLELATSRTPCVRASQLR